MGDHDKCSELEPSKYLKSVYYEETSITRLELMKWVANIEHAEFLDMLYVPHFSCNIINTISVLQLLHWFMIGTFGWEGPSQLMMC